MSLIMHMFGLAHFDAHILPLLVNTGERHKQTTHIVRPSRKPSHVFFGLFRHRSEISFQTRIRSFFQVVTDKMYPFRHHRPIYVFASSCKIGEDIVWITLFMYSVAVDVVPFMFSRRRDKQRPSTATLTENVAGIVLHSKFWKTEAHMIDPLNCLVCLRLVLQLVK